MAKKLSIPNEMVSEFGMPLLVQYAAAMKSYLDATPDVLSAIIVDPDDPTPQNFVTGFGVCAYCSWVHDVQDSYSMFTKFTTMVSEAGLKPPKSPGWEGPGNTPCRIRYTRWMLGYFKAHILRVDTP